DVRAAFSSSRSFFFQAEDGIRGDLVTGVQTCALPSGRSDDVVRPLVCLCNEAIYLFWMLTSAPEERKHRRGVIPRLSRHDGPMEGAAVDPRWSPGLQSPHAQGELAQPRRESVGGCITGPSAGVGDGADANA